jgi:hypothetical protein
MSDNTLNEYSRAIASMIGIDLPLQAAMPDWLVESLGRVVLGRRSTLWRDEREYNAALAAEVKAIKELLRSGYTMGALFDKVGPADSPRTLKTLAGVR